MQGNTYAKALKSQNLETGEVSGGVITTYLIASPHSQPEVSALHPMQVPSLPAPASPSSTRLCPL